MKYFLPFLKVFHVCFWNHIFCFIYKALCDFSDFWNVLKPIFCSHFFTYLFYGFKHIKTFKNNFVISKIMDTNKYIYCINLIIEILDFSQKWNEFHYNEIYCTSYYFMRLTYLLIQSKIEITLKFIFWSSIRWKCIYQSYTIGGKQYYILETKKIYNFALICTLKVKKKTLDQY